MSRMPAGQARNNGDALRPRDEAVRNPVYVPPCCRRYRAPAPSPPACASRPPSPPRPLWRSGPCGTLGGGKGGSHRQPPFGRTAHLRLCARGQLRLFAPPGGRPSPSRGRALRRANWPGLGALRRAGQPCCGLSAGAARACALRRASAAAPPLPPAFLRALRSASLLPVRLARRVGQPPRPRVGASPSSGPSFAFLAAGGAGAGGVAVRLLCPRRVRGGGALRCVGPPVFRGGPASLLPPRRSCASAGAAWCASVRCGLRGGSGAPGAPGGHVLRPAHPRPLPRPAVAGAPGLRARTLPAHAPLAGRTPHGGTRSARR